MQQALVLLSNNASDQVLQQYTSIKNATQSFCDCFLLYHQHENYIPESFRHINYELFSNEILTALLYKPITDSLVPGSTHFPLLKFYLKYPHYNYYWFIEDDVRFNGDWGGFFPIFNRNIFTSDLLSCAIRSYEEEPGWYWWNSINHPSKEIPQHARIRSFNPLYRISNAALQYIHNSLIAGWYGHQEVLLPTLLHASGFKLIDFGGRGKFVIPGFENKFYTNPTFKGTICTGGTFRHRPEIDEMTIDNLLYHPVKNK